MPSFSVLRLWHTYAHPHPNRGSKWTQRLANGHILHENVLFKVNFEDEGNFEVNYLFDTFSFWVKCLLFQLFSRDISMHVSILSSVQNGGINHQENIHFLLQTVLFEGYFQTRSSFVWQLFLLYIDYLPKLPSFSVLTIWHKHSQSHLNSGSKRALYWVKMVRFC